MATFNKFNDFVEQLGRGVHNFGSHTFKAVFSNTAPSAANTILSDITQIGNGGGYTGGAGGGVGMNPGLGGNGGTGGAGYCIVYTW